MAASSLYLGLDGTKALVYDADNGEVVGRGSFSYELVSERPGQAEQAPSLWVEACKECINDALSAAGTDWEETAGRVAAIGVSGQQHGLVALDAEKQAIRPAKLWCDTESALEADELSQRWGVTIVPAITASKLLWLQRHEPQHWERLAHVLLPHDYINYWLTGRLCMEASDASGTGLYDLAAGCWDASRIAALGDRTASRLPDLIGPNEVVGTLRPELAKELRLPATVQVAPGGGDNAMAALGAGAVKEGTWILSLGTSGTLFGPSSKPILDPSGTINPFASAAGNFLPLLCTLNCTGVTEEVRHSFGLSHEEITALAAKEAPGCSGASMLPYFVGERTPNWPQATGAILGLRPGMLRPGLLYRAAMEGATFSLLAGMRRLQEYGLAASELRVVGGGSNNKLWRRVVADAFQLPLRFPAEPEAAALGAALQAAAVHSGTPVADYVAAHPPPLEPGALQPAHEAAEAYRKAFQRHQRWGGCLYGGGSCDI
ncbi:hypothetical protein ABPG75_003878 [Micractinium tetrahymenae]